VWLGALLAFCLGAAIQAPGQGSKKPDLSADIFDPDKIQTFEITIPPLLFDVLLDGCRNRENRPYVRAHLKYGDEVVEHIGLRLKGEASCRDVTSKPAFKIKIDSFVKDQRFHGLQHLTLNNTIMDPSMMVERIAYHVYRQLGVPAPRAASVWVTVNGQPFGLYTNVETEDKAFLRRWFSDNDGNLYEEGGSDLTPGSEMRFDLETNKEKNDRSDLANFINVLNQPGNNAAYLAALDKVLDTAHFLKLASAAALVDAADTYPVSVNNFRMYSDPVSKRFYFLPWGMDLSLRGRGQSRAAIASGRGGTLVIRRCLAVPECDARFRQTLAESVDAFEKMGIEELAIRIHEQIRDRAFEDPRKMSSNDQFVSAAQTIISLIRQTPASIRQQFNLPAPARE
jgi:spore coat protein CotH